jgi:hypothetical protein
MEANPIIRINESYFFHLVFRLQVIKVQFNPPSYVFRRTEKLPFLERCYSMLLTVKRKIVEVKVLISINFIPFFSLIIVFHIPELLYKKTLVCVCEIKTGYIIYRWIQFICNSIPSGTSGKTIIIRLA